jgi:lipid A ethanolaminephosphotransferase
MYVSDHGESLGENGIYLHGLPYAIAPDFQKHIPAVLYFGNNMKEKREMLKSIKTDRYSHDYIFHTFLGLFGIETKEYDKNLDIFKNLHKLITIYLCKVCIMFILELER